MSLVCPFRLSAQSSAFTYQGRLATNGYPVNGGYDFQFALFAEESGGNPVRDPVTSSAVGVSNGLFMVLLDFGANVFSGQDRWLAIAVRSVDGEAFTALSPRQRITPAPYALTALKVLGIDGSALHAPDGIVTNAVTVANGGNVGIGTTTPASRFHVTSASGEISPPRLESSGPSGFNAGWDFYHGATGKGYVGVPDAGAPIAPGEMLLFGGPGAKASLWGGGVRALTTDLAGDVGIGTAFPRARLDVRGDVALGPNGEFDAVGSPERVSIVRGTILGDGTIRAGFGFLVSRQQGNRYVVTFHPPFAEPPTVTGSVSFTGTSLKGFVMPGEVSGSRADLWVYDASGNVRAGNFNFIAVGRR
jgi:hypothetical protein